jgi:hypothetical protein
VVELKVEYASTFVRVGETMRLRGDTSVLRRFKGDCSKLSRWPLRGVDGEEWWRWCVIVTISDEAAALINPYDDTLPEPLRRHKFVPGMKLTAVDDIRYQSLGPHSARACYTHGVKASVPPSSSSAYASSAPELPPWAVIRIHVCEVSPTLTVPQWALEDVVRRTMTSPRSFAFNEHLNERQVKAAVTAGVTAFERARAAEAESAAAADVAKKRPRTSESEAAMRIPLPVAKLRLPDFAPLETWLDAVIGQRAERALVLSGAPRAVNI